MNLEFVKKLELKFFVCFQENGDVKDEKSGGESPTEQKKKKKR